MRYVIIDLLFPIYQHHVHPRLLQWYVSYVEPTMLPFYQSYLAVHITTIYHVYMSYLSMYVQPIWLWIYNLLHVIVGTIQEGHLMDHTATLLSNIYTTYEVIIASLCENPTIQNIFGTNVDVIVTLLGYLIMISLMVFLIGKVKKIIYGSSIKKKKVSHPLIHPFIRHVAHTLYSNTF